MYTARTVSGLLRSTILDGEMNENRVEFLDLKANTISRQHTFDNRVLGDGLVRHRNAKGYLYILELDLRV